MMTEPSNDSSSGFSEIQSSKCPPHHWVMGSTTHARVPGEGISDLGQTDATCKRCGVSRRFEAATVDNIHGIDSHIYAEMARELGIKEGEGDGD